MTLRRQNLYIIPILTVAMLSFCTRSLYGQVYGNKVSYGAASGSALGHRSATGTMDRFRRYSTGVPVAPAGQGRAGNPMAYNNRARGGVPAGTAQPRRADQVFAKRLVTAIQPQKLGQQLNTVMRTPRISARTGTGRNPASSANTCGRINTPKFGSAGRRGAYGGGLSKISGFGDSYKSGLSAKSTLLSDRGLLNKTRLTYDGSPLTDSKSILNRQTGLSGKTSSLAGLKQ